MSKILVVGPAWIGDMVMAQSLYMDLRRRDPEAIIDVLAPGWSAPVLARMPEVRRIVEMPLGHGQFGLVARYRLGRALRREGYERAIVLPRSLKSALVPWFARIPQRTGFRGEHRYGLLNDIRPLDKEAMPLMVQRYLALGAVRNEPPVERARIPYPDLRIDTSNQRRLLEKFGLDTERPVVAFMPAAEYGPAKRWPPEHFAALARALDERGMQIWLFGSQKDRAISGRIAELAAGTHIADLAGRTGLEDAIDLIALADWAVSNDSGLMHVAAATGRRLVAIYGSSTPGYTPPLTDSAEILWLKLSCSPCFERECPFGHYDCLRKLRAEDVLARMEAAGFSSGSAH